MLPLPELQLSMQAWKPQQHARWPKTGQTACPRRQRRESQAASNTIGKTVTPDCACKNVSRTKPTPTQLNSRR